MANPVAYNQGTNPSGALKSGTMSMSIASSLDITGYNWRNGFENSNIWVIYSDTYSMGQTTQGNSVPTIWATPVYTDSGLVTLINSLSERAGQTPFTTISDAVTWLIGQGKYFLSNQNYPMLVSNGLLYFMDAGFAASYPTFGTSLYDLSGNNNTGTLVNGTGYVNSNTNGYFTFDGTDDKINIPGSFPSSLSEYTVEYTAFLVSQNRMPIGSFSNNSFYKYGDNSWYYTHGGSAAEFYYPGGQITGWGHWVITYDGSFVKVYRKGVILGQQASSGTANFSAGWILGYWNPGGNYAWDGYISSARIYNRALSQSEVLQNYYKGPIVTNNLSYLWDASNLVSYYSGSSTTYEMLNTGVNGTLQNGVGYSGNYGGYWQFDGSDDRILLSSSITLGNGDSDWTVNAWMRTTATGSSNVGTNSILSNTSGGPIYSSLDVIGGYQSYWAYPSNIGTWKLFQGTVIVNDGEWHMLTYVNKSNYTMDFYVDGVYDTTVGPVNVANNNPLDVIGRGLGNNSFNGSISMVQVNKGTAMNASQVSQQYGATRGRFQSYQAYANGGTVTTITQNGVNYRVHTFTSSGTLSVTQSGSVEVLVVAGGGGGSGNVYDDGAGGGAGGLIHRTGYNLDTEGNITVTVGAGGGASSGGQGGNGGDSSFGTLTALGGGGGAAHRSSGVPGGSGGGGGGSFVGDGQSNAGGSATQPGSASGGLGNRGGNGGIGDVVSGGGGYPGSAGGGGAGSQGFPPTGGGTNQGGRGGDGVQIGINGTLTYYAGGGGGVRDGVGGLGGGGNASFGRDGSPAGSGGTNTGGGGGGGRANPGETGVPGPGGSGIIIIRYPIY